MDPLGYREYIHLNQPTIDFQGTFVSNSPGVINVLETNIAPENGWLEDEFPLGMAYFQVLC